MSKKTLLLLGIILAVGFFAVCFFTPKHIVQIIPPTCDPTKTDCSKFTPDGTPFERPPEPVSPTTTTQVGQIDEHLFIDNTLRDVNFCGKMYRVKQVKINGVDVVQRVAEIATKNLMPETFKMGPYLPPADEWRIISNKNGEVAKAMCENVFLNNHHNSNTKNPTTVYEILEVGVSPNADINQTEQPTYLVSAPGFHVVVNSSTNEIFDFSDFDGSSIRSEERRVGKECA